MGSSFFDVESPGDSSTVTNDKTSDQEELLDGRGTARLRLTDEWSPRLSIVWDPLRDGRSRVFAAYGRYYQSMPQALAQDIVSDSGSAVVLNGSSAPNSQVNDPGFGFPNALCEITALKEAQLNKLAILALSLSSKWTDAQARRRAD